MDSPDVVVFSRQPNWSTPYTESFSDLNGNSVTITGIQPPLHPTPDSGQNIERSVLEEALEVAGTDRSRYYGHPKINHDRIARLWNAYDQNKPDPKAPDTAEDAAFKMILLKIAREQNAPKRDNLVDICGYVRCLELIQEYRKEYPHG